MLYSGLWVPVRDDSFAHIRVGRVRGLGKIPVPVHEFVKIQEHYRWLDADDDLLVSLPLPSIPSRLSI
jgi:hypothetical protein